MIRFLKRIFKGKELENKANIQIFQIYCQACGRDITSEGGDVSSSGRIYCHGYKRDEESRCLENEMTLMAQGKIPVDVTIFNYHNPQEMQEAIKKGKLKKYDLLEKITGSN